MKKIQQKEIAIKEAPFQTIVYNKPLWSIHFLQLTKVNFKIGLNMS